MAISGTYNCMPTSPKSDIELYVISRVKAEREARGKSQEDVASILDLDKSFIGQIESPARPEKYNLNHLNAIAVEFDCSIKVFFPDKPFAEKLRKKKKHNVTNK